MPLVIKHEEQPPSWFKFRHAVRHRWALPFWFSEWVLRHVAFYLSRWSLLEVLEYIGSFSVLVAVVLYFTEAGERRQQKHYQAWQVINTAQGKGGNGGRIDALEQLNSDHILLTGVDVSGAFLQGVKLEAAELRRATMYDADMRDARLRGARLIDADLHNANLRRADLTGADLTGCNCENADFAGAVLTGANLSGANLKDLDLTNANLAGTSGWESATGIGSATVTGVQNAPASFLQAVARGRTSATISATTRSGAP